MCGYSRCWRHFLMVLFVVAVIGSNVVRAAELNSTLERIRQTGTIRIGYGDEPPFSYVGPEGKVIGYSIDLCTRIAETIRTKLGLNALAIEYVFRTPANRIQQVINGAIDIECVTSTNSTEERRRNIAFSNSYFLVGTRYVSLRKNDLHTLESLRGRSISIVLGTINASQINRINREMKLNLSAVVTDSIQKAFDMVGQQQVSAFAMDDILLRTLIARTPNPQDYAISDAVIDDDAEYGFMMRRSDEDFHRAVNEALGQIYANGEIYAIYDRWFTQPLPGIQVNLNFPLSEKLRRVFLAAGTHGEE